MPGKILAVCLGISVVASIGCTGEFVSREIYERDLKQVKEYNSALERDMAELKPKAEAYDQMHGAWKSDGSADKTYAELAESLKKALAGMDVPAKVGDGGELIVTPRGDIILSDKLLNFASGKFEVSARGKEIIKTIAATHHGSMFRLVGHTDMKPIKKPETQQKLMTDTNAELSALRAIAVMGEFKKCGIDERQILSVEGHGWHEPRGNAESSRRVEIFFVGDAPDSPAPKTVKTSAKKASNR